MSIRELIYPPEKEGREKHTPHIEAPDSVKAGEPFKVDITVGKEVPHPNTMEHHIKWIQLYATVEGRSHNPVHIATFELAPTHAEPKVTVVMKLEKTATLHALSYCNLHGIWENTKRITVH